MPDDDRQPSILTGVQSRSREGDSALHGALDAASAQELQNRLIDVIDGQGTRSLIIDLRLTTFIDSAGFAALFDAWKRMHDRGGEFMLSGPTNDVACVILASDLENVFVITPAWAHPRP